MEYCKYCNKECSSPNSKRNHERLCKSNPDYETNALFLFQRKGTHHVSDKWNTWSKGKTKETDSRLKAFSDRYKGKKRNYKHSAEIKEKISVARSKQIEEKGGGGFLDIGWYNIKNINGVEFKVRGTWELKYAEYLNSKGILWDRLICFKYKREDNVNRTYYPDFHLPLTQEYKEIKGYFSERDKTKISFVEEQNKVKIDLLFKEDLEKLGIL